MAGSHRVAAAAVEVDADSVRARCKLAETLAWVGDLAGARRGYRELLADDDGSCHVRERLEALNEESPLGVLPLDDPMKSLFYF